MDGLHGVIVCFLLLGPLYSQTQLVPRDNSNIVFAPPSANPPGRSQQRPVESNVVYRRPAQSAPPPQQPIQRRPEVNSVQYGGGLRPTKDTDGAIYQKTVGGVSFKIVSMCQEFDTVFKPGLMEFDTLQGGCRFVITFDKNLPASQTVYTPGPVYSASSAVNPYYQSQAVERRREYYNQPPEPPAQQRAQPRTVVREPAYPPRQSYPPPRQEPTRVVRYQSGPAPPPETQYAPRVAPPPPQSAARPAYQQAPQPTVVRVQQVRRYEPARAPSPPPQKRTLDRYQLEALGVGTLHDPAPPPAVTVPPQSEPPIPRV